MDGFLKSKTATILTVALLCQVVLFYGFSRTEVSPRPKPLANFTMPNNGWRAVQDVQLDKETLDVLNADDILSRVYQNSCGRFSRSVRCLFPDPTEWEGAPFAEELPSRERLGGIAGWNYRRAS